MTPFKNKVIEVVNLIPSGKVMSYGQVALYIGLPRAARQVGWTLREFGDNQSVPWWRVINKSGRISISGNLNADRDLQKKLLESEGVEDQDYQVDMGKYRFVPTTGFLKSLQLGENYIQRVGNKFSI